VVKNGRLLNEITGVAYTGINLDIVVEGNIAQIRRGTLATDTGPISLSGRVDFRGIKPEFIDLALRGNRVTVLDTAQYYVVADIAAALQGPSNATLLKGQALVREGTFNIAAPRRVPVEDIQIVEDEGQGGTGVIVTPRRSLFFNNMRIDATVDISGNDRIRGAGIDAVVKGEVYLRKTASQPLIVTGDIETVRGTYSFRGREFVIEQGRIRFPGDPRIENATLDVRGTARIQDIVAIVLVDGTVAQPKITVQSDPPRDESEILSYIVFGRPLSQTSPQESVNLRETTLGLLGSVAAQQLQSSLGREYAPDVIEIQAGSGGGFGVGKYITDNLFLRYQWNYGTENITQTIVEYRVNRYFTIHTQLDNGNTSGIDLFFDFNY
jgi:translocation and assembly module TamB